MENFTPTFCSTLLVRLHRDFFGTCKSLQTWFRLWVSGEWPEVFCCAFCCACSALETHRIEQTMIARKIRNITDKKPFSIDPKWHKICLFITEIQHDDMASNKTLYIYTLQNAPKHAYHQYLPTWHLNMAVMAPSNGTKNGR